MRTFPRLIHWAVVAALAGEVLACSTSGPPSPTDDPASRAARATIQDRRPDIIGTITNVTRGSDAVLARVRIEEKPDQRSGDDKAVVDVTRQTRIFRRDRAGLHAATISDLRLGAVAEAWFTGPVRESYPLQATGAAIVIR